MRKIKIMLVAIIGLLVFLLQVVNPVNANQTIQFGNIFQQYNSIEKTQHGVKEYKALIDQKTVELKKHQIKEIFATITFAKPLTFEELQDYIKEYNITPKQIQVRGLVGEKRITIAVRNTSNIQELVANQLQYPEPAIFVGYIDMYAFVDYNNLDDIQKDPKTFLLDTSGDSYFNGKDEAFPHALSWMIEDLGLR